jgi:hypothetical protein
MPRYVIRQRATVTRLAEEIRVIATKITEDADSALRSLVRTCYKESSARLRNTSTKASTMNPVYDNLPRQDPQILSARLGELAAERPATTIPLDPAFQTPLSRVLRQLRHRRQLREHAADNLRAQEFVMEP